jgi:hypothetical protein
MWSSSNRVLSIDILAMGPKEISAKMTNFSTADAVKMGGASSREVTAIHG